MKQQKLITCGLSSAECYYCPLKYISEVFQDGYGVTTKMHPLAEPYRIKSYHNNMLVHMLVSDKQNSPQIPRNR